MAADGKHLVYAEVVMRYGSVWFADGLNEAAHNFPYASDLPRSVDVAVVGAGLSGLALGYFLKRFNNSASVLILEASHIGAGGSGRTGGIVLNEAPCRPMPGTMSGTYQRTFFPG